ncbi:MAG: hypothetical protein AAF689_11850 [Pseudomonadota bacterium]
MFTELKSTADRLKDLDLAKRVEDAADSDFSMFKEVLTAQKDALTEAIQDFQSVIQDGANTQKSSYEEAGKFFSEVQDRLSALDALNEAINTTMDALGASPLAPEWHRQEAERIDRLTQALIAVEERLSKLEPPRRRSILSWFRRSA